ncbi:MAG: D-tagatose-bisphosphate aldolase, class II, non-catalytic subunit [Pseudomonadota bacterium]
MRAILDLIQRHKAGAPVGLYSVCSAHPVVLAAALQVGQECSTPVLVEATSNQVNQYGGYTGMRPADFRRYVAGLAREAGFPEQRLLLGGDHLGPNCWQSEPAEAAMAKAEAMVADYVRAGFRKIHLDCSMACADDPVTLDDATVAARAARLCAAAEAAHAESGGEAPVYVVGTEVPVPGGAHEALDTLAVTTPGAAAGTLAAHQLAFTRRGLGAAWERVVGLVVQPGVEFDHHKVIDYAPDKARELSRFIDGQRSIVYEAHSTDYQTPAALKALVEDHFAIIKVGPGATYALRETLWSLAEIEDLCVRQGRSQLKHVVLETMQRHPQHWQRYYHDAGQLQLDLQFSLSDRIRYYWAHPQVQKACAALLHNLSQGPLPLTLLSQHLPHQYAAIRGGRLDNSIPHILRDGVARVLRHYARASQPAAWTTHKGEPLQ